MKNILSIIASPRKLGNCEVIIKEISAHIPEDHRLRLLRLPDFNIRDCTGCYRCLYEEKCFLDDDLQIILDAMADADAYMVAAPTYFLGAHSSLKSLLDRGLSFYSRKETLWGKPSVAIAVAGIPAKEGSTLLGVTTFLKSLLSHIKGRAVFNAALPGEAGFQNQSLETAQKLGRALFGKPIEPEGPRCPLCGGDSFRFPGNGMARCMQCGNDGVFSMESGTPSFHAEPGNHDFFLDKPGAIHHEAWLRQMKDRLKAEMPNILKVRAAYRGGEWVSPLAPSRAGRSFPSS